MYKKFYILTLSVITIAIFSSCATTGKITPTPPEEQTQNTKENESHKINRKAQAKTLKDKTYYLETDINYPFFEGRDLLNKAVENSIMSYYNEFSKAAKSDWQQISDLMEENETCPPFYYGTTNSFMTSKKYTSVLIKTEISNGGAHPTTILNSYNYDENEKTLKRNIAELTGFSYEELSELSRKAILATLNKRGSLVDKDWIETGTEPFPDNFEIFLMSDDFVYIYFEPYKVAPYSEGILEIALKLKK